jgi:hypothetical protein
LIFFVEGIDRMSGSPIQYSGGRVRTGLFRAAIIIPAFLLALLFGRHLLAVTYRVYDDEGYMLLSLYHYFAGGHLYTEVFSQYGPFNFFAERFLFWVLHQSVSHDGGRFVTLICWLLSAILGGYFIFKVSKNTALASAAGLATMALGAVLADEPGHPQQLILPLLMLACCLSVSRRPMSLLLLGVLGAGLFFIKINVGVFYFVAIAQTLVCELPAGRFRNLGAGLLLVFAAGGPLLLMRQDLQGWARSYCLLAIACGVSTFIVAFLTTPPSPAPMRNLLYMTGGAILAAALIVAETIREGMSASTLVEGVFWAPLRHPRVFEIPLSLSTARALIAMLVSACIVGLYCIRDRWQARANLVNGLRCATGLCVATFVIPSAAFPLMGILHLQSPAFLVALIPLGLIPAKGMSWQTADVSPRLFVASLAATQILQAYPVAGSQLSIALAPLLLWAVLCVHDGAGGLFSLMRRVTGAFGTAPHRQEAVLGGLSALAMAGLLIQQGAWPKHDPIPSSSLRGAASLHLPRELEDRYESLANDIKTNCSMLFTMPGMGSLNFWSGVPTPNGLNFTDWTRGFNLEQQQQILHVLAMNPRSCVVYNEELAHFWGSTDQDLVEIPLAHHILFDMRKVREEGGYTIFVDPRRSSAWIEAGADDAP